MTNLPTQGEEIYIGDGVYASFDGFQIKLRTSRLGAGDHVVYLEPSTWRSLKIWINRHRDLKRHMEGP